MRNGNHVTEYNYYGAILDCKQLLLLLRHQDAWCSPEIYRINVNIKVV